MAYITVTLPDGSQREYKQGTTGFDVAQSIGAGLAKAAIALELEGTVVDLNTPINNDAKISLVTPNTDEGREVLRHSTAHIMAQAVFDLFPGARYAIGPAIKDGFYYDFELPNDQRFNEEDLEKIEKRMKEIVKANQKFVRGECSIEEGLKKFADQPFKIEIIEKVQQGASIEEDSTDFTGGDVISYYGNIDIDGNETYTDLCTGPHVPSTGYLKAFKLMRLAGAYWRGDEKRPMLQRIYGTAWENKEALEAHIHLLEEAKKRDHRKLGQELGLFTFSDLVGSGLPLYTPKGTVLIEELKNALKEISRRYDMLQVSIPHIAKIDLYETSGHAQKFGGELFHVSSHYNQPFVLKPVNCPHHTQIYAGEKRSYRDLPLRYVEQTMQYRDEKPGSIGGLQRTRGFTVDDGHTFCRPDQIRQEASMIVEIIKDFYSSLGLWGNHWVSLSVRDYSKPENYIGDPSDWDVAEKMLQAVSDDYGLDAQLMEGEAAIYGPKLDFMFEDALHRVTQLATIQLDFAMPKRFELEYTDSDGNSAIPVMIHRAILGSFERFIMLIIEHFAGNFPLWLSPTQVTVAPVADRHEDFAYEVVRKMKEIGVRAVLASAESETLGSRIRKAKTEKVPYILVVGDDDVKNNTVGVNKRGHDQPERDVNVDIFINALTDIIATKSLEV